MMKCFTQSDALLTLISRMTLNRLRDLGLTTLRTLRTLITTLVRWATTNSLPSKSAVIIPLKKPQSRNPSYAFYLRLHLRLHIRLHLRLHLRLLPSKNSKGTFTNTKGTNAYGCSNSWNISPTTRANTTWWTKVLSTETTFSRLCATSSGAPKQTFQKKNYEYYQACK